MSQREFLPLALYAHCPSLSKNQARVSPMSSSSSYNLSMLLHKSFRGILSPLKSPASCDSAYAKALVVSSARPSAVHNDQKRFKVGNSKVHRCLVLKRLVL